MVPSVAAIHLGKLGTGDEAHVGDSLRGRVNPLLGERRVSAVALSEPAVDLYQARLRCGVAETTQSSPGLYHGYPSHKIGRK